MTREQIELRIKMMQEKLSVVTHAADIASINKTIERLIMAKADDEQEIQHMAKVVRNIQKSDSIRVEDGMRSTQVPASLVVSADTVFGEMCRRGNTSPELRVFYGALFF